MARRRRQGETLHAVAQHRLASALPAETWYEQASYVLPITDLTGTEDGQWCAEQFELAWRRANN
ncbi:MAG: hypothetical protein ABGY10_01870 [bacterium]|nr:hypothetical protein [Gemmatimonadota bacterium]